MQRAIPASRRIGYVLNAFPVVSETFILNELRAMRRGGVAIAILALSRRRRGVRHRALDELDYPVRRPPRCDARGCVARIAAHVRLARRQPRRYAKLVPSELLAPFRRMLLSPTAANRRRCRRRWQRFQLAVWVADGALRLGVVHLHAHYAREPLAVAALVRRLTGLPYSFAAHAKDLYTAAPEVLSRRLARAEFAVACHEAGRRVLEALAAPGDSGKIRLVHHGIDTRLFRPPADAEAAAGDEAGPLILAVGRLTPKKGFEQLVAACGLLREAGRRFHCVIVGEGRQQATLRRCIAAAGLDGTVRLQPFVSQEALAAWYRRAAVLAAPSRVTADGNRDGIPNVVLEAMACGLPVVSTAVGGVPEVIDDGQNGLLVPGDDPRAFAEALGAVLADPARRRQLGAAAAAAASARHYLDSTAPLVREFRELATPPAERILAQAAAQAWHSGGLCRKAARALGIRPRRQQAVERGIAEAVAPGLAANAWRPDFDVLARRRLWDEAFKARRLARMAPRQTWRAQRVLDLGCGRGGVAVALAAWGARVVGLDLRPRNCRMTRLRARRYDLDLPTVAARAEALPFGAQAFDHIFCLDVLEHVRDPVAVLREIHRVLAPGGSCTVTMINRLAHVDPHYHLWGVNFVPRTLANRYITLRGRAKSSWQDLQTLDEMHYFTYRRFVRLVHWIGFDVVDPERPDGRSPRRLAHELLRRVSLGFNTATLTLVARAAGASGR